MKRKGYSLVEVLACIALFAALLPAVSKAWVSLERLHRAQETALDGVLTLQNLEHDFRLAVRHASGIVPQAGAFKTEGRRIVLGVGEGYTIFDCDENFQPLRIELTPENNGWRQAITRYPMPGFNCRFGLTNDRGGANFYARPSTDRNRQGNKKPTLHLLAALAQPAGGGQP